MKEFFKLIQIYFYILKLSSQAVFLKKNDSRKKLTQILQWSNSEKGNIPKNSLVKTIDSPIFIHQLFLQSLQADYSQRICLQTTEELMSLLSILKLLKPQKIFEFGLYKGGTLIHFLLNTSKETVVHSLDITHDHLAGEVKSTLLNQSNIHLIKANSNEFNFTSFYQSQDFVYIDGGHDYVTVKNDSEHAFKIIHSCGVIVWDDYSPSHPGVFDYLNELFLTTPNLVHIKNTSIVVLDKSNKLFSKS